jgi:hypothetical protein
MRTTVTLDPDVERLVRQAMDERGLTFKDAINEGLRAGIGPRPASGDDAPFATHDLGAPLVDVTKALQLAGELEDAELTRKLAVGR